MNFSLNFFSRISLVLCLSAAAPLALADTTTLTSHINVDNSFNEYISDNANSLVGATKINTSGSDWGNTGAWWNTFSSTTAAGLFTKAEEYLIIEATNFGWLGGFLGEFSLSGSNYTFANGTQTLLTGDQSWQVSSTGVNGNYGNTSSEGLNGAGPWGYRGGVSGQAQWLSDPISNFFLVTNGGNGTLYFETVITSTVQTAFNSTTASVPEPETMTMFAIGLLGIATARRKAIKAKI